MVWGVGDKDRTKSALNSRSKPVQNLDKWSLPARHIRIKLAAGIQPLTFATPVRKDWDSSWSCINSGTNHGSEGAGSGRNKSSSISAGDTLWRWLAEGHGEWFVQSVQTGPLHLSTYKPRVNSDALRSSQLNPALTNLDQVVGVTKKCKNTFGPLSRSCHFNSCLYSS